MKTLNKLGVAVAFTLVLSLPVLAGEIQSQPCAPPEPGQTETMPCNSAQLTPDDSATPGQIVMPPSSGDAVTLADVAVDVVQGVLMLF